MEGNDAMLENIDSWYLGEIAALVVMVGCVLGIGMWVERVRIGLKTIDDVQPKIGEINSSITRILFILSKAGLNGHGEKWHTLSTNGPNQLTRFGSEISRTFDFQATAKELAPKLRQRAAGKLKYDIQTLSFDFIRREYQPSREVEVRMKTYSYDKGVPVEIILDVLAVELRDQLL